MSRFSNTGKETVCLICMERGRECSLCKKDARETDEEFRNVHKRIEKERERLNPGWKEKTRRDALENSEKYIKNTEDEQR